MGMKWNIHWSESKGSQLMASRKIGLIALVEGRPYTSPGIMLVVCSYMSLLVASEETTL